MHQKGGKEMATTTIGGYLATRLQELGIKHFFAVPGDYNLALFDRLLENKSLQLISCCNELNAGYAADGYARAHGVAAMLVTYSVGGLSAINAVAGHYAEDLPVIVISGAPNTHSEPENQLLHHTLGEVRYNYVRDMFAQVTAESILIRFPEEAPALIDHALSTCLKRRKPVYLEVPCNLATLEIPEPKSYRSLRPHISDPQALEEAVEAAAAMLNSALKPVMVGGSRMRIAGALEAFRQCAESGDFAVAMMPNAKGFFPEQHPNFIGIYWGPVSSPGTGAIVESADAYLFAGPITTDYVTCGHTIEISTNKLIFAGPDFVRLPHGIFNHVMMADFLSGLAGKIRKNATALEAYRRIRTETVPEPGINPDAPIRTRRLFSQIQGMLAANTTLIAETGDSWFNAMYLTLPQDANFEIQMQYGSIGWSVGATLGYQLAAPARRVIALIGDGSFQMTAQEVSTMIRYGIKPIIFVINNGGYTIEVEIHDGPYNVIKNWNYAELVKVFNESDGNGWGCRVRTEGEAAEAIKNAMAHDGVSLIEVIIDKDDCSKELLEWGTRVSANNSRPPAPTVVFK